jgi:hypothetical protein
MSTIIGHNRLLEEKTLMPGTVFDMQYREQMVQPVEPSF